MSWDLSLVARFASVGSSCHRHHGTAPFLCLPQSTAHSRSPHPQSAKARPHRSRFPKSARGFGAFEADVLAKDVEALSAVGVRVRLAAVFEGGAEESFAVLPEGDAVPRPWDDIEVFGAVFPDS